MKGLPIADIISAAFQPSKKVVAVAGVLRLKEKTGIN